MVKRNMVLIVLALMLISIGYAQGVYAEVIYKSGNWVLDKNELGLCTASTKASLDEADYIFKLSKAMDQPIQISIEESGESLLADILAIVLSGEELAAFGSDSKAKSDRMLWHVPNNAGALIKHIKAAWKLPVESIVIEEDSEEVVAVVFSLKGSTNTLRKLEKECNDGLSLQNDVLLNALEHKEINIESLKPAKIKKLQKQYLAAFNTIAKLEASEISLVDLEAESLGQISQQKAGRQPREYV